MPPPDTHMTSSLIFKSLLNVIFSVTLLPGQPCVNPIESHKMLSLPALFFSAVFIALYYNITIYYMFILFIVQVPCSSLESKFQEGRDLFIFFDLFCLQLFLQTLK